MGEMDELKDAMNSSKLLRVINHLSYFNHSSKKEYKKEGVIKTIKYYLDNEDTEKVLQWLSQEEIMFKFKPKEDTDEQVKVLMSPLHCAILFKERNLVAKISNIMFRRRRNFSFDEIKSILDTKVSVHMAHPNLDSKELQALRDATPFQLAAWYDPASLGLILELSKLAKTLQDVQPGKGIKHATITEKRKKEFKQFKTFLIRESEKLGDLTQQKGRFEREVRLKRPKDPKSGTTKFEYCQSTDDSAGETAKIEMSYFHLALLADKDDDVKKFLGKDKHGFEDLFSPLTIVMNGEKYSYNFQYAIAKNNREECTKKFESFMKELMIPQLNHEAFSWFLLKGSGIGHLLGDEFEITGGKQLPWIEDVDLDWFRQGEIQIKSGSVEVKMKPLHLLILTDCTTEGDLVATVLKEISALTKAEINVFLSAEVTATGNEWPDNKDKQEEFKNLNGAHALYLAARYNEASLKRIKNELNAFRVLDTIKEGNEALFRNFRKDVAKEKMEKIVKKEIPDGDYEFEMPIPRTVKTQRDRQGRDLLTIEKEDSPGHKILLTAFQKAILTDDEQSFTDSLEQCESLKDFEKKSLAQIELGESVYKFNLARYMTYKQQNECKYYILGPHFNLRTFLAMKNNLKHRQFIQSLAKTLRDDRKRTPLMVAARSENIECARLLLENGADVHAKDAEGNTALHFAVEASNVSMCKLLLESKGSKVELMKATNNKSDLPLHLIKSHTMARFLYEELNRDLSDLLTKTGSEGKSGYEVFFQICPESIKWVFDTCLSDNGRPLDTTNLEIFFDCKHIFSGSDGDELKIHKDIIKYDKSEILQSALPMIVLEMSWQFLKWSYIRTQIVPTAFLFLFIAIMTNFCIPLDPVLSDQQPCKCKADFIANYCTPLDPLRVLSDLQPQEGMADIFDQNNATEKIKDKIQPDEDGKEVPLALIILLFFIAIFWVAILCREGYELWNDFRIYWKDGQNWLQAFLILFTIPFPFLVVYGKWNLAIFVGNVTCFLACWDIGLNVALFLPKERAPNIFLVTVGIFNLLWDIMTLIGFPLSFAFIFFGLKQRKVIYFPKVLPMLTGELEFKDTLEELHGWEWHIGIYTFLAFILILNIVVTNLIIGLTIKRMEDLQKKAHVWMAVKKVKALGLTKKCALFFKICLRKDPYLLQQYLKEKTYMSGNHNTIGIKMSNKKVYVCEAGGSEHEVETDFKVSDETIKLAKDTLKKLKGQPAEDKSAEEIKKNTTATKAMQKEIKELRDELKSFKDEEKKKTELEQKKKTELEEKKKTELEQKKKTEEEEKQKTELEQKKKTELEQEQRKFRDDMTLFMLGIQKQMQQLAKNKEIEGKSEGKSEDKSAEDKSAEDKSAEDKSNK